MFEKNKRERLLMAEVLFLHLEYLSVVTLGNSLNFSQI